MKKHLLAPIAVAAAAAVTGMVGQAQADQMWTNTGIRGANLNGPGGIAVQGGIHQNSAGDGVFYDGLENPWTTILTGNTYVLTVDNTEALGITQKNTTVSSAMFADDLYPDSTVAGQSVTDITVDVSDDASHNFASSGAGSMGMILTIWNDNGTGTAPGTLVETINGVLPLFTSDYGFVEDWTLTLSPSQILGPLAALPNGSAGSLFWVGLQFSSTAVSTKVSGKTTATSYYVNSMGFGLFTNPTFGTSGVGLFVTSTFGNFASNPTGYGYGDDFYAPGNPSTNIDTVNYPTNLGIELDGNPVPEPSTLAALGVGGLAAALRRRRR